MSQVLRILETVGAYYSPDEMIERDDLQVPKDLLIFLEVEAAQKAEEKRADQAKNNRGGRGGKNVPTPAKPNAQITNQSQSDRQKKKVDPRFHQLRWKGDARVGKRLNHDLIKRIEAAKTADYPSET